MIKLSKIDENLNIYKQNKIIIFGASSAGMRMYKILKNRNLSVYKFCDNDSNKWGKKMMGLDISIISLDDLLEIYNSENIVVQIGSVYENEIENQLKKLGINNIIMYTEAQIRLRSLVYQRYFRNVAFKHAYINYFCNKINSDTLSQIDNIALLDEQDNVCFVCLPPKTADTSIMSLENLKVKFFNLWHEPSLFEHEIIKVLMKDRKRIKVITAVRDPIMQNLSLFFSMISRADNFCFCDLNEFWKDGGDVQLLYEKWLKAQGYISAKQQEIKECIYYEYFHISNQKLLIQDFWREFLFYFNDIFQIPFDKKRGYSIISESCYEIFIYQLEKLDLIQDKLFEWLKESDIKLPKVNVGEDKWSASLYKQAQKEIMFSQEYFEKCYNEPFVRHFYSDEDIEKFKNRWKDHII